MVVDSFIGHSTHDGNSSDYYEFANITRSVSGAEEDTISESDVERCLNNNVEARNYWPQFFRLNFRGRGKLKKSLQLANTKWQRW